MDFKIGKVRVSNKSVVVIAEAGVNHLGRMDYAEKLIKEAKISGADIIKFQTYKAEKLTTKNAPRFWNWEGEKSKTGSQFDSYSELDSFGFKEYQMLKKICDHYDIEFMSTPFDESSVDLLTKIGVNGFKIASCDITNYPLIEYIAKKRLPIFLSTGASDLKEIQDALNIIEKYTNKICIMHCTLCYPTIPSDANLSALKAIKKKFPKYILGLSDHTLGIAIPSSSVLFDVRVIEKHYTIDKNLPKSADHWLSLDPKELKELVENVKVVRQAIGEGLKECLKCEKIARKNARRSIVTARDIKKGEILSKSCLILKRPGTGLPAKMMNKVLGKSIKRNLKSDTLLSLKHIK